MDVTVIGAGLAGCECAWQLAVFGLQFLVGIFGIGRDIDLAGNL